MLRKSSLIETVNDQLQNISQLVHSRHRSVFNFIIETRPFLIDFETFLLHRSQVGLCTKLRR